MPSVGRKSESCGVWLEKALRIHVVDSIVLTTPGPILGASRAKNSITGSNQCNNSATVSQLQLRTSATLRFRPILNESKSIGNELD